MGCKSWVLVRGLVLLEVELEIALRRSESGLETGLMFLGEIAVETLWPKLAERAVDYVAKKAEARASTEKRSGPY